MPKNYEKLAESLEYENAVLKSKFKQIEQDLGLLKIHSEHQATLLASCEKALESRDKQLGLLCKSHRELEASKGYCCCGDCPTI